MGDLARILAETEGEGIPATSVPIGGDADGGRLSVASIMSAPEPIAIPHASDIAGARKLSDDLVRLGTTPARDTSLLFQAMVIADITVRLKEDHPEMVGYILERLESHKSTDHEAGKVTILAQGVAGLVRTALAEKGMG
jgi:hypothetical protein